MNWLLSFPKVDVLETKLIRFRSRQFLASRLVSLGFNGWGFVRILFRQHHKEQTQKLTSFWFARFDQIEIIFPENAQLSIQVINIWGLISRSFVTSDWLQTDHYQPNLIVDDAFEYNVKSPNLRFVSSIRKYCTDEDIGYRVNLHSQSFRLVNKFVQSIVPHCKPLIPKYNQKNLDNRLPRIEGYGVVIPTHSETEAVAQTERK